MGFATSLALQIACPEDYRASRPVHLSKRRVTVEDTHDRSGSLAWPPTESKQSTQSDPQRLRRLAEAADRALVKPKIPKDQTGTSTSVYQSSVWSIGLGR